MGNAKKKQELNILNVFLCMLVIFIHSASEAVMGLSSADAAFAPIFILWKCATVAVPAFLFVSGVKLSLSLSLKPQGYLKFMGGKLLKIYLPYVLYVCLYYAYYVWMDYFPFAFKNLLSYVLIGNLTAHFYFVVIIMQFFLLMPLLKWLIERYNGTFLLAISLVITLLFEQFLPDILRPVTGGRFEFLYNDRIFTSYLFYYVFGMIVGKKYNAFLAFLKENKGIIIFFGLFVLLFNVGFSLYGRIHEVYFGFLPLLQSIYCMGVLPLICLVAIQVSKCRFFESVFFKIANAATFNVYLLHLLIMFVVNSFLVNFGLLEALALRFAATLVISFYLCMAYVWLKQKFLKKQRGEI